MKTSTLMGTNAPINQVHALALTCGVLTIGLVNVVYSIAEPFIPPSVSDCRAARAVDLARNTYSGNLNAAIDHVLAAERQHGVKVFYPCPRSYYDRFR